MQSPENIKGALEVLANFKLPDTPPITEYQKSIAQYMIATTQVSADALAYIRELEHRLFTNDLWDDD